MRKYTPGLFAILLAIDLTTNRVHAQAEVGWLACPFVFDATAKALMLGLKTKLNPDEFAGLGDLVCTSVKLYQDYNRYKRETIPLSRETAERFFCIDPGYSQYCNKTPLVPPTFDQALRGGVREEFERGWAAKCLKDSPNAQSCVASILNQARHDAGS